MIKLYGKTVCEWKCKTYEQAEKEINDFCEGKIHHEIQLLRCLIETTKRKIKPFNIKVSYYDLKTIQEIINDKKED